MRRTLWACVVVIAALLSMPTMASAQSGSSIAGVVKDTTGAVMPGVTVEASSPALIEKVRSAVTDAAGQYKIVNLVPGTYSVTFTLTGFNTIKREGIELTASFTANVNADLKVGSLEETITVSGQAPTVDVQNVTQESVMTRDILSSIPAGMRSTGQVGVLIPGVTSTSQDVGGTQFSAVGLAIHGSRLNEQAALYDGMPFNNGQGRGGQFVAITTNDATVQEMAIETAGLSAEAEASGVKINLVPRDGGNTFKGLFIGSFTNHSLQSDNLSSGLIARGLTSSTTVSKAWDADPAVGGPLVKDKLWFWGSVRGQDTEQTLAGIYFNLTPTGHAYTPDLSQPAINSEKNENASIRLTWQISPKNKLNLQQQNAGQQRPYYGYSLGQLTSAPEAIYQSKSQPMYQSQATWNSPRTSKLLLEAGALFNDKNYWTAPQSTNAPNQVAYSDSGTGFSWGNYGSTYGDNSGKNFNMRFAASYVTGSHAFKTGVSFMRLWAETGANVVNNGMTLQLLNGVPRQVTVWSTPFTFFENMSHDWAAFAQDQWTFRRMTLNLGLRFDALEDVVPAQTLGAGPQVPTRSISFGEVDGVPNWKNVTPRAGVAYDIFGNGKTAVKFAVGKYLEAPNPTTFTRTANPAGGLVQSATRTWTDLNGDFIPEANELGPINPPNFGSTVVSTRYANDALTNRIYNWEVSAQVQHEIVSRVSVNAGYFRRWYGNLRVQDNLNIAPTDYSPFSVTAPADPRLPGGGGYTVGGLYDPNFLAAANNVITLASNYGNATEVYNGFDFTVNARLPQGIVLAGGPSIGRTETNYCFTIDSPEGAGVPPSQGATSAAGLLYCDVKPPFQPNVKVLGVYPLPWWGVQFAATFQSLPG
ncbi:MAG TPA: TonB-dependent receptor, partial [Vicinamibacterales bacterium]|nr:TonB-dependent receptor [Vicinamibacterales bacterium]